ncbi:MAG: hypothetical protein ACTSPD_03275 [Promethearchaeota archaeon]
MPSITFKLMGVFGDRGERQILVDTELSIKEVKELVRREFKLVPNSRITFLHNGKRYGQNEDDYSFMRIPIDPRREKITVIVSSPYLS